MRRFLEPYKEPEDVGYCEARDWLRQELSSWPYVTERMRKFLDALYWRQRAAVTLHFGERLPWDQAGYRLGVSPVTLKRDLISVCEIIESRSKRKFMI